MYGLVYDGTAVNASTYGFMLQDHPLFSMPNERMLESESVDRDGGFGRFLREGIRGISIIGVVKGRDLSELMQRIDDLCYLFDPTKREKLLTLEQLASLPENLARGWWVQALPIEIETPKGFSCEVRLRFQVSDPYAVTLTEFNESVTVVASPHTLYVPSGLNSEVPGNRIAWPVTQVTNSGTAVSPVSLQSMETGDTMTWNGTLDTGHILKADSEAETLVRSTDGGTVWTNVIGQLASAPKWPTLLPRERNELRLTGVTSGTLSVSYRGRFA